MIFVIQTIRASHQKGTGRKGRNSTVRRPSKSLVLSDTIRVTIGTFWASSRPGARKGVFGGSETGRPEGRPERPPRRSTTRSKSTRSSRRRSVSLSSVVSRSVLLRDVVVGKIFFLRPDVGLDFFFASRDRMRKL